MGIKVIESSAPLADPTVAAVRNVLRQGGLTAAGEGESLDVEGIVRGIIADVEGRGDAALVALERRLDKAELTPDALRVPPDRIAAAHGDAEPAFLDLIRRAAANIRTYQEGILHRDPPPLQRGGRTLGVRYTPVDRVGVYVPGGRAVYPSTVLMTVVPAQVAGVREVVMASPPTTDGDVNPMILALAGELGVAEVYRLGGAPAIAALAVGTEGVKPVDKIVGPGNAFVAAAKRQLFGRVGIDSIAGPSEVLIVADDSAHPDWIAADLLSQAEHDPGAALLVTPSRALADSVVAAIERQLPALSRAEALRKSLEDYSAVIVVPDMDAACDVANAFACEHLQIVTGDDAGALSRIRHAGAVFLGPHTPVPVGDYYAGPSHVLPTGCTARFFGPLSCNDFLKASSIVCYDAAALAEDAPDIADFASREGLTGHARAVRLRTETDKSEG